MEANSVAIVGKLPKFTGKTPINAFLKQISKRAHLEGWSDDKQASIIRYLCAEVAEAFLDSKPELETSTLEELVLALRQRFKTRISKPAAYAKIMNIRQGSNNINEFVGEIETAASTYCEAIPELREEDGRDQLLISVFMNGVQGTLKKMLITRDFDTFGDLVRAAIKCEEVVREINASASARSAPPIHIAQNPHRMTNTVNNPLSTFHYNNP